MTLTEKIGSEIRHAKEEDKQVHISDFQVRVTEKGAVLVNLKTSQAQLIEADKSDEIGLLESVAQ